MSSLVTYFIISALTVASPGAAVVFTITNTLTKGPGTAIRGYIGVAIGILVVGYFSHEMLLRVDRHIPGGLGWVTLFGACYFLRLAATKPHNKKVVLREKMARNHEMLSGVLISVTNPKALLFFTSVYPLYLDENIHFFLLIVIFAGNVIFIHSMYTLCFTTYKKRLSLNEENWQKITRLLYLFLSISCFVYAFKQM